MIDHKNLPSISIDDLLLILTKLKVNFSLQKENQIIKSFPVDFRISSVQNQTSIIEHKLNNDYVLYLFDQQNIFIKDRVRNARHDIYNLINTSMLGLDYTKSKFTLKNDIHRCEVIEKNLTSVTKLLETIFDETAEKEKEQFLLNKTLLDLARIFASAISKEKTFTYTISDNEFFINGINEDIFNSILNLLINADEATDEEDSINLSLEVTDKAKIVVSDNGKGISQNNLELVFERGFSTKNKKHESGIGLSNVKKIIEEHGGTINVFSEENVFTKFEIVFEQSIEKINIVAHKSILFADDDEMLLELIYDLLSSYDFNVITVKDGKELVTRFDETIDLIIADRNMPNLNGINAVKEIRMLDKNIPIIISTGFTRDESEEFLLRGLENIHFIDKPYNFEKLLNLINSVI